MAKLDRLRQILEAADQGSSLILDTAESSFPTQLNAVKNFATDVLQSSALTFVKSGEQEILDTSEVGKITVIGKTQLFDFPKVELTLVFTEPGGKLDMNATVKILPEDKVKIPNISDFFDKFLEPEMVATLPDQLLNMPQLSVNAMTIEIGPKPRANSRAKTIKELSFDLRANANVNWELIPGFLSTKRNGLNLTFKELTDASKRRVSGTIKSTLQVGSAGFEFELVKNPNGNKWTMKGGLAEGQVLTVSDFASKFLSAFSVPTDLPSFEIDEASFTFDLFDKKVTFESSSSEGLSIAPGFTMNDLGIAFERTPGTPVRSSAGLVGTLLVAGVDMNLSAEFEPKSSGTGKEVIFESGVGQGNGIPIGNLISDLAAFGNIEVPSSIDSAEISDLRATFQPGQTLAFGFLTVLETETEPVETNIDLLLTQQEGGFWAKRFDGLLLVGDLEFEMSFSSDPKVNSFFASLRPGEAGEVSLSDFLARFVEDPDGLIPSVNISLENAFVLFDKPKSQPGQPKPKGTLLVGVSVGANMSFGDGIPLVGPMLNGQKIEVDNVTFTYSTSSLPRPNLRKLNLSLPKGKPRLPEVEMPRGIGLSVSMILGKMKQYLAMPIAEQAEPASPGAPPPPPAKPEKEGKWFSINKRLGPLSIASVGVNFKDSVLTFGLEANLALGPLDLALEELTVGSRIDRFAPQFGLRGFGIGWTGGPVEISGFFLRKPNDEFVGAALIKTPTVTLKAIGAFAMVQGEPSFYLYAYLGYPIGGPAFFFVEGLAAGFGFNRSVAMPSIDKVKPFPLVAIAIGDEPFLGVASRMANGNYVPIDIGKLFLAVGVRFTTFKQLDSFLLLIATFGNGFRLDLLGLSKLTVPSPGPQAKNPNPLAEIELAVKGTFAPSEGFVGVQAQLTDNSYILSKDCKLTGGFAFFTWFDPSPYAGDFVITVGGYHPKFQRPSHYPTVPRLGFNWTVTSTVTLKGGMYFALTPSVVMAGGRLEATYKSGGLKAWFIIGADFIIGWKPFFYDAHLYINLGVSYTFWFFGKQTLSFDLGADLHIWGPDFSGTATIDLGIIEFTVEFGAGASQNPKPIRYSDFKKSYIPENNVANVSIVSGLLKEAEFIVEENGKEARVEEVWVVNPKEFLLVTDSPIPTKRADILGQNIKNQDEGEPDKLGIATMMVAPTGLSTIQSVEIIKGNDNYTEEFIYGELRKSYPSALWGFYGSRLKPDKNDKKRVITEVLSGVTIKPKPPAQPKFMGFLDQDEFKFQTLTIGQSFQMGLGDAFTEVEEEIEVSDNATRAEILQGLGFDFSDFELDETTDFGFTHKPVVGHYTGVQVPA